MRILIALLGCALLTGCGATVVDGSGAASPTTRATSAPPTDFPASSAATASPSPSSTGPHGRTPASTAIGDPATADLCPAIGLGAMSRVAGGMAAAFDDQQYLPGCSVALSKGGRSVADVSIYASTDEPQTDPKRSTRTVSGVTVYVFPFDATGGCKRQVAADGVLLDVDAYQLSTAKPTPDVFCGATDAMSNRLAQIASGAGGAVPRLPLPEPSLASLDWCDVQKAAGVASLPAFAGGEVREQDFGVNCGLRTATVLLYFNYVVARTPHPASAPTRTVGSHVLYETTASADSCTYVSQQAELGDGRHEQLLITAAKIGSGATPPQLCNQTRLAAQRFLDEAGLR